MSTHLTTQLIHHDTLLILYSLVVPVNTTVTSSLIMINATGPWGPSHNSTTNQQLKQLQQLQTSFDTASIAWLITPAVADEVVGASFSFPIVHIALKITQLLCSQLFKWLYSLTTLTLINIVELYCAQGPLRIKSERKMGIRFAHKNSCMQTLIQSTHSLPEGE